MKKFATVSFLVLASLFILLPGHFELARSQRETFEMTVKGVAVDPNSNAPMVLLQDMDGKKVVPIAIGPSEAQAISMEIAKVQTPRPLTYELITRILVKLEAKVMKIVINDVKDNIVYAQLHLKVDKGELTIDSRPSDAINIALRSKATIYVTKKVRDIMGIDALPKEKGKEGGITL